MVDGISSDAKLPLRLAPTISPKPSNQPENLSSEPESSTQTNPDRAAVMPSGRAKVSVALSELQAETDLQLNISDRNGLNQVGRDDITGSIDGKVSINQHVLDDALRPLVGLDADGVKIKGLKFDQKQQSYILSVEGSTAWGAIWDNFDIQIKTNPQGQLYLQLDDNWMPNKSIISRIQSKLQNVLKSKVNGQQDLISLRLDTRRDGDKLFLTPVLESIKVPTGKSSLLKIQGLNSASAGKFSLDQNGHLEINFDRLQFLGSSDEKAAKAFSRGKADTAQIDIYGQLHPDGSTEVTAKGNLSIDLDAQDVKGINLGGENLSKRVESTRLEASLDTDISISANHQVQVESRNQWRFEDTKIQGRRYDIASEQIDVSLDTQTGLKLEIRATKAKPNPFNPKLTRNVVEPIIDGPAYFKEMLSAIGKAKESIELETFLMYKGEKTKTLMRALALKAAGLKESPSGLKPDPASSKGIPVHVLFNNNKQSREGALPTIQQFEETVKELNAEIQKLPLSDKAKKETSERLQSQLQWGSIERGVAKADHRKLLIIDGQTGYTGGINLGNHFLQEDSYHDIMLKLNGPAVREMQDAFTDNWKDFTGQELSNWNKKSVTELDKHRDTYARSHKLQPTAADIVTTDERSTEIEAAYLHAIENANKEIYVEQAYYFYPPVQAALKRALERGVTIQMIVPQRSDEELFDIINLHQIRDLMQTQKQLGRGEVKAYLYTGKQGQYAHTVHTKALSADGQMAVVGSANLTPRSLRSPFKEELPDGTQRQVLFNEEMSVYLEGDQVKQLNQQLFEADKKKAIELNYDLVEENIDILGGEKALQAALLKAQLT